MAQAAEARKRGKTREPKAAPAAGKDRLLKAYHDMLLIRRFEEKAAALRHGADRRLLPPLHRPGGCRCRHAMALSDGDEVITSYRDHGHDAGDRHGPARRHGGAVGKGRGLLARQGRVDALLRRREGIPRRPRASSAHRSASAPGSASATGTAAMTGFPSSISARARPARARCSRASTLPRC